MALTYLCGELHFCLPGAAFCAVFGFRGGPVISRGGLGPWPAGLLLPCFPFTVVSGLLPGVAGRMPVDQVPQEQVHHPKAGHLGKEPYGAPQSRNYREKGAGSA